MPTMISGQRGGEDILQARRKYGVPDKIWLLQADITPLLIVTSKLNKKPVSAYKFDILEDELSPWEDAINNGAGYDASATSLVVDNGDYFKAGDVVKVPRTGEVFLVTAVSTNTLTVTRGYGETAAAALVDDDPLVIIANVLSDGDGVSASKSTTVVESYNYTTIVNTPFTVSPRLAAMDLWGEGDEVSRLRKKKLLEHKLAVERLFLMGERKKDSDKTIGRGLLYWIQTNVTSETDLTETEFVDWLGDVFTYGNSKKMVMAGSTVISAVNYWARGKLVTYPKDKTFGINIAQYLSPFGEVGITHHKLLTGATYSGYAVALDTEYVGLRYLAGNGKNYDVKLYTGLANNDEIGKVKESYYSDMGLYLAQEKVHGLLKGVSTYS